MNIIKPKIGNSSVNTTIDSTNVSFDNTISKIQKNDINSQKTINTVSTPLNSNNPIIENYDLEVNNGEDSTVTLGNMTITIKRLNGDDSTTNQSEINTNPISIYTDFLEEHGSTSDSTFGVDQAILGTLDTSTASLINLDLNDILFDSSVEEKSLTEVLQERGNLSTLEGLNTLTDALLNGVINTNDVDIIGSLIIYIAEAAPQASQEEITQRIQILCENLNESSEYTRTNSKFYSILNKLEEMGFSEEDALFIIENLDSIGACSYASTANAIFSRFMNDPSLFELIFGFPMYDQDATFNGEELLLDLYIFANSEENGGKLFTTDPNDPNKMTINYNPNDTRLTMEEQVYITTSLGINEELLKEYIKSKGTNLTFSCNSTEGVSNGNEVVQKVQDALENEKLVSIGLHTKDSNHPIPMTLINDDGSKGITVTINGGHSVYVTGITENNELIISSWGKKYILSIDDLNLSNTTINEIEIITSGIEHRTTFY